MEHLIKFDYADVVFMQELKRRDFVHLIMQVTGHHSWHHWVTLLRVCQENFVQNNRMYKLPQKSVISVCERIKCFPIFPLKKKKRAD